MFFYVDESGNTGNNLFDAAQPRLSYGVLSSSKNVDYLGCDLHKKICKKLGVDEIHANHLGVARLTEVASLLIQLQDKMKFSFDYYYIDKPVYSLVMFFEAVFDAGLNEAVPWVWYWTAMKFPFINQLSRYIDEEDLKESWRLCLHPCIGQELESIVVLLSKIKEKFKGDDLEPRFKEVVSQALDYGIKNPEKLDFGSPREDFKSPNVVCFQFVVGCMAKRLRKKKRRDALGIYVDQQSQFNYGQLDTHKIAQKIEEGLKATSGKQLDYYVGHPLHQGLEQADILRSNTPKKNIEVRSSAESVGLQIVDVYLWIVNRFISDKPLSEELEILAGKFLGSSFIDGISLEFMAKRWASFEEILPSVDELTEEEKSYASKLLKRHGEKVEKL